MRTLLVHYLPRDARSRTRRLLDAFRAEGPVGPLDALEEADLAAAPPPLLDRRSLPAYVRRNYLGETLAAEEAGALAAADRLVEQLIRADLVVLAFPLYNFSVPAPVKAWMDAVMQKGRTWAARDGRYAGLLHGRKALS